MVEVVLRNNCVVGFISPTESEEDGMYLETSAATKPAVVRSTSPNSYSTQPLPQQPLAIDRLAVVLNHNANKVNDRVAKKLRSLLPASTDFYYSHSLEEAESFARQIVHKGYGTVISGGGDGTLTNLINQVCRYIDEANERRVQRARSFGEIQPLLPYPEFGLLKLGTGNGLSSVVGAKNPREDLHKLITGPRHRPIEVDMLECEGQKFFFGGIGYDARILNDYIALKKWAARSPYMKRLSATAAGYLMATISRSVPAFLRDGYTQEVRVVNTGDDCYFMDPRRGDRAVKVEKGAVLFEGHAGLVGAGTSPFFGFGFKVFPFAGMMPGFMNLRIATTAPLDVLANLPAVWRGQFRTPTILDFCATSVRIECKEPSPYQHSGDGQGLRQELNFKVAAQPVKLVDYHGMPL